MSDSGEEQFGARSDAASSRRQDDLRFEALTSRINKVESYLEEIAHHITANDSRHVTVSPPKKRKNDTTTEAQVRSTPTPAVGCAESYIQTEDPNDDTVSVLVDEDFSDQEEQNISYETKDYTQHIFYPEPNLKREFTPHEAIQKFVSRHFTTSLSSHRGDFIQEECGLPIIEDFVVPKVNPEILNSEKVQQNRNIVESDKRVSEIQDSAFAVSWPLITLENKIVTSDEDIEVEEVLDRLQQSLMCIGSAFKGLSVQRHKRFRSCLTKEFSSLTDEKDPASDKLSEYLFGNDLSERITQQLETSKITRRVVTNNYEGRPLQGSPNRNSFFRRRKKFVKRNTYRKEQPRQGFQNRKLSSTTQTNS